MAAPPPRQDRFHSHIVLPSTETAVGGIAIRITTLSASSSVPSLPSSQLILANLLPAPPHFDDANLYFRRLW